MLPFRTIIITFAILSGLLTSFSVFAYETVFDRLDGTGPSKKRVDVIEWDENLEVHVYPKSSTKGLGAKLDDRESTKKVMVIGYHFNNGSEPLVRRAILGVPFTNKIKGFVDPTEKEFDKYALSNQDLPSPWVPYKLQPAPTKWGPDGSKFDEESTPEQMTEMKKNDLQESSRAPASVTTKTSPKVKEKYVHPAQRNFNTPTAPAKVEHNDGGVQEYSW